MEAKEIGIVLPQSALSAKARIKKSPKKICECVYTYAHARLNIETPNERSKLSLLPKKSERPD